MSVDLESMKAAAISAAKASVEAQSSAWALKQESVRLAGEYLLAACPFKPRDIVEGATWLRWNGYRHEPELVPGRVVIVDVRMGPFDDHVMAADSETARATVYAGRISKAGKTRPGVIEITHEGKVVGRYQEPTS